MATLGFSVKWPQQMGGSDTGFIPKIWRGLIDNKLADESAFVDWKADMLDVFPARTKVDSLFSTHTKLQSFRPKITTIREDPKGLWKPGRKIHMVVFNRTKNRFQFAPVLECKAVQEFEIKHSGGRYSTGDFPQTGMWIDGKLRCAIEGMIYNGTNFMDLLAHNDGFDSIQHFLKWFNRDFKGRIIHWTNLKY